MREGYKKALPETLPKITLPTEKKHSKGEVPQYYDQGPGQEPHIKMTIMRTA